MSNGLSSGFSRALGCWCPDRFDRSIRPSFVIGVSFVTDTGFSDWSPWSDCQGVPCRMGHQQRMRTCVNLPSLDGKKSICHGDKVQERACSVACSNQNASSSPSVRPFSKGNEGFTRTRFDRLISSRCLLKLD